MFGLNQPQNRSPSLPLMAASLGAGPSLSSLHISSSSLCFSKSPPLLKLHFSFSAPTLSLNSPFSPLPPVSCHKLNFKLYSAVQEIAVKEETQEQEGSSDEKKKKLFVVNLPWGFSVADMKTLFGECGTVKHVEIIKAKDGRHKGFAFITMDSADEAQAVVEKFDSHELSGRIIRVEFAKSLKKPTATPAAGTPAVETGHKLYVSNLAWKARATDLREFFSAEFNPVSARVVFDRPQGGSAGYGFVSFATKDEAEAAISSMDGKVQGVVQDVKNAHEGQVSALSRENKAYKEEVALVRTKLVQSHADLVVARDALLATQLELGQTRTKIAEMEVAGENTEAKVEQLTEELRRTYRALHQARETATTMKSMYEYSKAEHAKFSQERHQDKAQLHYHSEKRAEMVKLLRERMEQYNSLVMVYRRVYKMYRERVGEALPNMPWPEFLH